MQRNPINQQPIRHYEWLRRLKAHLFGVASIDSPVTQRRIIIGSSLAVLGTLVGGYFLTKSDLPLYLRSQAQLVIPTVTTREFSWTPPQDTTPGTKTLTIEATDDVGATTTKQVTIEVLPGNTPTIYGVQITPGATDATLAWQVSQNATSEVKLDLTTDFPNPTTTISNTSATTHTTTLTNLIPCTNYRFLITAIATQPITDTARTFATTGCPGNAPIIGTATATFPQAAGGSVTLSNAVILNAPASFATDNTHFQIHQIDRDLAITATSKPTRVEPISGFYEIHGLANPTTLVTTFTQPLTLTLAYTPSANTKVDTIAAYRWSGSSWSKVPTCTNDAAARTLTCTVNGFSTYGVFGEGEAASQPAGLGGDSGGGGSSGGGGGGAESTTKSTAPGRTITFQIEKDHKITGAYSGIEPSKKTVVLGGSNASVERKVTVARGTYYLEVHAKHDKPGPVNMVVYLNNKAWKVVKLDKNDNKYRTHRLGLLKNFSGGTIRFRLLNDTFDKKDPANTDKDRNLHIDWWRLVAQ